MDYSPRFGMNDLPSPGRLSSPDYNKYTLPTTGTINHMLNDDLMNDSPIFIEPEELNYPTPMLGSYSIHGIDEFYHADSSNYANIEVQSHVANPYLLLEAFACICFNIVLFSNAFMFALVNNTVGISTDVVLRYIIAKATNLSCLGLITYIFTTPDTYKSINLTIEFLSINLVIYEYQFINILKYLCIHLGVAIVAAFVTIGMYYDIIKNIPTATLLATILPASKTYSFTYSYVLIAIVMHLTTSIGITIVVNSSTSINAKQKAIHKALLLFFVNLTFGVVIGPVGYIWQNLVLYIIMILVRAEYSLLNIDMFITYAVMIISIIVFYPLIAIQIKFLWRNRYRRYIEYGIKK